MVLRKKQKEYFERIKKIFPELGLGSSFSMYSGEYPISAEISLRNQSKAFKNKYEFSNRFIHYTSLDALFGILSTEELRLYNCFNLNDKEELKYAISRLNIKMTEDEQEEFRRSFFIFSGCEIQDEAESEDYNLWRLYGSNGNGVAIEFEITNPKSDWTDIYYGKVNYGEDNTLYKEMKSFIDVHQEFDRKHFLFNNIPSIIPAIGLHFKNKIWEIEKEIRLLAYCPYDKYTLELTSLISGNPILNSRIEHVLSNKGNPTSYLKLPINIQKLKQKYAKNLSISKTNNLISTIPHLKINRIILGYNNDKNILYEIGKLIDCQYAQRLKYNIKLQFSKYI